MHAMATLSALHALLAALVLAPISCGGAPPPPPPPDKTDNAADQMPVAPPADAKEYAARIPEGDAAKELGAGAAKLTQIEAQSPKTHAALLKDYLWKPVAECEGLSLVAVHAAPGLLVPKGDAPKLRADVYARLKDAGALAKQRGTAIEVLSGHEPVGEAVKRWNAAVLDTTLEVLKLVPAAERKEKSAMGAVRKRLDPSADPASWGAAPCASGRLGGYSVAVQLVALDAAGGRGAVLVKGGADGERLDKDTYEATYWDKAKGKNYRTLTEIMSAGSFVRQCSQPSRFTATPAKGEGTWRCREGDESWEPENRPLPAWQ
jgi:hypothetical protein